MAITKAEIMKIVHERLKSSSLARRVINIDNDLRDCLYELSNDLNVLLTSTTVTTVTDTAIVTKPSGLQHIFVAAVDEGNVLEPGSMEEYNKSIEDATGSELSALASGTEADSGTTTSATANKLVDSAQNFETTIEENMVVKNTTDDTYSYVTAVDSDTTLTLSSDIMASGDTYTIYENKYITPPTGSPTKYFEFDGNLYIYGPVPDAAYTVRVYGVLEEDDVSDIDLNDRCREALVWGVMYRLSIGGELDPAADDANFERKMVLVNAKKSDCLGMYDRARAFLRKTAHREPKQIKYRDV